MFLAWCWPWYGIKNGREQWWSIQPIHHGFYYSIMLKYAESCPVSHQIYHQIYHQISLVYLISIMRWVIHNIPLNWPRTLPTILDIHGHCQTVPASPPSSRRWPASSSSGRKNPQKCSLDGSPRNRWSLSSNGPRTFYAFKNYWETIEIQQGAVPLAHSVAHAHDIYLYIMYHKIYAR